MQTRLNEIRFRQDNFVIFFIAWRGKYGGGGEIRTHGRVAPTTIFKTVAFNRSATPPGVIIITETKKIIHLFNIHI